MDKILQIMTRLYIPSNIDFVLYLLYRKRIMRVHILDLISNVEQVLLRKLQFVENK